MGFMDVSMKSHIKKKKKQEMPQEMPEWVCKAISEHQRYIYADVVGT